MDFYRKDRSIPLSLWGTENMLEYFRDMRDLSYGECCYKHSFWPLWVQVVVLPEGKSTSFSFVDEEQSKRALDDIVKFIESLDETYHFWGNAVSIVADEFERELSVRIATDVSVDDLHTHVRVDEPCHVHNDVDIRFVLDSYAEDFRNNLEVILDYDGSLIDSCGSTLLSKLLVLRGYIANAMSEGRVLSAHGDNNGTLDGWVRVMCDGLVGYEWPDREMTEGYLILDTKLLDSDETDGLFMWEFFCDMRDAEEHDNVEYKCDLALCDGYDTYVVKPGFVRGVIDIPSWWDKEFEPDGDED